MSADQAISLSIGELADAFGVTARALRFYETKGLLHPRREGSARIYSAEDRARLEIILRGKRVGFSLDDIKEMLDLHLCPEEGRATLAKTRDRFLQRIETLAQQRKDIDRALSELSAGLEWIETRLAGVEPPEDLKERAAAFEALSRTWLYGDAPDGPSSSP